MISMWAKDNTLLWLRVPQAKKPVMFKLHDQGGRGLSFLGPIGCFRKRMPFDCSWLQSPRSYSSPKAALETLIPYTLTAGRAFTCLETGFLHSQTMIMINGLPCLILNEGYLV